MQLSRNNKSELLTCMSSSSKSSSFVAILSTELEATRSTLVLEDVAFVRWIHLLQEDEGEDCVWTETGVVRGEALPQTKETFISNHFSKNILKNITIYHKQPISILRLLRNTNNDTPQGSIEHGHIEFDQGLNFTHFLIVCKK